MFNLEKKENETWKECAVRQAKVFCVEKEVAEWYEQEIQHGRSEMMAAYNACYEWDCI